MKFEEICAMLAKQMNVDAQSITMETRLVEDLKADSLDVVELIMDIEQEYGIQVSEDDLPDVHTVGDIVKLLDR